MNKTEPVIASKYQDRAIRALQPLATGSGIGNDSKFQALVERIANEIAEAVAEERKANTKVCHKAAKYISENTRKYERERGRISERELSIARFGYETAKALAKEIGRREAGFGTARPEMNTR